MKLYIECAQFVRLPNFSRPGTENAASAKVRAAVRNSNRNIAMGPIMSL